MPTATSHATIVQLVKQRHWPGTSKWNKIEHRLFCHITRNWRARPLTSYDIVISTIAATTTTTGLTVTAALDTSDYPTGIKIPDEKMTDLETRFLTRHGFHGTWNYTLSPAPRPAPAQRQPPAPPPATTPAPRYDHAALNHHALTGMTPAAVTALTTRMDIAMTARREHDLRARRGGRDRDRTRAPGHPPDPRTRLTQPAKILATLIHLHLQAPASAIAPLLGVSPTSTATAIRTTRDLLTHAGATITPSPQPARTTTALLARATAAGITPAPAPDTPTEK